MLKKNSLRIPRYEIDRNLKELELRECKYLSKMMHMTRSSFPCFWANAEILELAAATNRKD